MLDGIIIAAIGLITARTARDYGLRVTIEANTYPIDRLVSALIGAFGATPVEEQR